MNFLAHAVLSPPDDAVRVGNVCADFIKGGRAADLPPGLREGVRLHRAIDRLTDRHPAFRGACARVAPERRRYAPVVVDVLFDHCLAADWNAWCATPLEDFVEAVCAAIERWRPHLAVRDGERLDRMVAARWLLAYGTEAGLERSFAGLNRRARYTDALAGATDDLRGNRAEFEAAFRRVFADVRAIVAVPSGSR